MFKINNQDIVVGMFPDGTPNIKLPFVREPYVLIKWRYDGMEELFSLYAIVRQLKNFDFSANTRVDLYMPYIPNARMDRIHSSDEVFTLKYFSEIINSMGFGLVAVLDPHSNVSSALINHLYMIPLEPMLRKAISAAKIMEGLKNDEHFLFFYPDEGAMKRYSGLINLPYAFGIKNRDWSTGEILDLNVSGSQISGKSVFIVDDICSKGGTFVHSAKKLKELGAKNIYLWVSHCESTIFSGELLTDGLIKHIWTSDSLSLPPNNMITQIACN
jgi:ribose-phosphate pyrophosphokinase